MINTLETISLTYELQKAVSDIVINNNNLSQIKEVLLSENYSRLNNEQKEIAMLNLAILHLAMNVDDTCLINYLIFDYKISKNSYLKIAKPYIDRFILPFFSARELNEELKINNELIKKRGKI
jgi:hypothetical protein